MSVLMRDRVAALIAAGIRAAQQQGDLPEFVVPQIGVERPRQAGHGDYGSPVCLQLAKEARMAPREIAARVVRHMPAADFAGTVEVAGPGYINLTLAPAWLTAQAHAILVQGERWGWVDVGGGERVQVEFVSANPTGPLTVASARNAAIGDVLASVLAAAGYQVEREYYVNDAGSQVRKFGESLYARYLQALGQDEPFPEDGYRGLYLVDLGRELAQQHGTRYLEAPRREAVRALGAEGLEQMIDWIGRDLAALGVKFDVWFHERSLYESGLFEHLIQGLRDKGYIVEHDSAVWLRSPALEVDAVVIRSPEVIPEPEERPTYLASDIAYVWNKLVERGFNKAIYVWGADHHGDVPRLKAAAAALGLDPNRVVIILYQMVNLKRGGQEVRMSKRTGEFVTLRELLDEVGPDPIRFMLLTRTVDSTMDFDLDLAVEQSDKNPVYYVQYAHARIASILRYAAEAGWDVANDADVSSATHESELMLVRKMLEFPEIVSLAATQMAPHHLTFYAQELAATFHTFYRDCRVVDQADPERTRARLVLVRAARLTLAQALGLLGVNAPERM
ncbi:MAG: arginine--tRNA ligase [Anaerolineales bacterium]|nr:arginine--tRNA ligase [Anaerolineales bacterium]